MKQIADIAAGDDFGGDRITAVCLHITDAGLDLLRMWWPIND